MGKFELTISTTLKAKLADDKAGDKNVQSLVYRIANANEQASSTLQYDTKNVVSFSLMGYNYVKKVYAPGCLKIKLMASDVASISVCKNLATWLNNASVSLKYKEKDDEKDFSNAVATNYYVFSINPRWIPSTTDNGKGNIYLDLVAYSADHRIAQKKYNQSFTSRKFLAQVVKEDCKSQWVDLLEINPNTHLNCIGYTTEEKKNDKTVYTDYEFKQPYLVQYNESLYDFFARTANRCGEFMYFEDGMLTIGLPYRPVDNKYTKLTKYTGVEFINLDTPIQDSFSYADNVLKEKNVGEYAEKYCESDMVSTDEYLFTIKKGEWTTFAKEYGDDGTRYIINAISKICQYNGLAKMIGGTVAEFAWAALDAHMAEKNINAHGDKAHYNPTWKDQRVADSNVAYPFTTVPYMNTATNTVLGLPYLPSSLLYQNVLVAERKISQQAIIIDLGTAYQHLLVGDIIEFNGCKYVIVGVDGSISLATNQAPNYSITAVPLLSDADKKLFALPPVYDGNRFPVSSAQRAYVTDNEDPLKMGRVRIRYPWQVGVEGAWSDPAFKPKSGEQTDGIDPDANHATSSPWVRMATNFTVEDGGIHFLPPVGAEVLVEYENGNIEKPYIVGMLYNAKTLVPDEEHVIKSTNGHKIVFNDPQNGGKFLDGLWGGFAMLTKYLPQYKAYMSEHLECLEKMVGGIELTDEYGFYNIKMSSDKRSVDIESPFGKVGINAFTGITISAPNGNIKIEGKNVAITATNNLTLTSGKAIKDGFDKYFLNNSDKGDAVKEGVKDIAQTAIYEESIKAKIIKPIVDLSLVRTIWESVIKPCEGSLRVKSYRYLMMEAGKGQAMIPKRSYKKPHIDETSIAVAKLLRDIEKLSNDKKEATQNLINLYNDAKDKRANVIASLSGKLYQNDALTVSKAPAEVENDVDALIASSSHEIKYVNNAQKAALTHTLTQLTAAVKAFKDAKEKDTALIGLTTIETNSNFKSANVAVKDADLKEHILSEIKKLIKANDALTADESKANWVDYVNSIKADDSVSAKKFFKAALSDIGNTFMGTNSRDEFGQIWNPYIWSDAGNGEILMSGENSHTLSFDKGQLRHTSNLNANGTISVLKSILASY